MTDTDINKLATMFVSSLHIKRYVVYILIIFIDH